jgi:hypothetical protein
MRIYWPGKRDLAQRRTEPMYVHRAYGTLMTLPGKLILDVESGKFAPDGDLALTVDVGPPNGPDWSQFPVVVRIQGLGAVIATSDELHKDVVPESGYIENVELTVPRGSSLAVYVRTRAGHYGVIALETTLYPSTSSISRGVVFANIRLNPSGSRHVEFDHTKWLNRN